MIELWPILPVLAPLLAATVAFLAGRGGPWLAMLAGASMTAAAGVLAAEVWADGPRRVGLGDFPSPPGIALLLDGPGLALLLAVGVVGTVVGGYAALCWRPDAGRERAFWPLWILAKAGLATLCLSGDLFNLYVGLEVLGLAAVGLIALGSLTAAVRYLLVSLLGSLAWLLGVALVYAETGALDLLVVGQAIGAGPQAALAFALMMAGMALKCALFPLHAWLPPAHAHAPTPVSALLSALVAKSTVLLALRLWLQVFPEVTVDVAAYLVGVLGAGAVLWGGVHALREQRVKLLVAWSTVAQLGYLFLVFPLLRWHEGTLAALLLLVVSHGLAKSGMFLAAGEILRDQGHDRIEDLGGVGWRLPVPLLAFGVSGITLMGLPPGGSFVAKWALLEGAILLEQAWLAAVLLGGGLLAAAYVFRVLDRAVLAPPGPEPPVTTSKGGWIALALALAGLGTGFVAGPLMALAGALGAA